VVTWPCALTEPDRIAEENVALEAPPVLTLGADGTATSPDETACAKAPIVHASAISTTSGRDRPRTNRVLRLKPASWAVYTCPLSGSGVVAVDEGFGGLAHRGEVSAAESVDRPLEPEQAVSSH
jgi:hypothetical protein